MFTKENNSTKGCRERKAKKMINLFNIIAEGIKRAFKAVKYFIKHNLKNFSKAIQIITPFIMFYLGARYEITRYGIIMWIAFPIISFGISAMINWIASNYENDFYFPLPKERFTKIDSDGEVSIESKRVQELILWVAEIEDWAERKGLR